MAYERCVVQVRCHEPSACYPCTSGTVWQRLFLTRQQLTLNPVRHCPVHDRVARPQHVPSAWHLGVARVAARTAHGVSSSNRLDELTIWSSNQVVNLRSCLWFPKFKLNFWAKTNKSMLILWLRSTNRETMLVYCSVCLRLTCLCGVRMVSVVWYWLGPTRSVWHRVAYIAAVLSVLLLPAVAGAPWQALMVWACAWKVACSSLWGTCVVLTSSRWTMALRCLVCGIMFWSEHICVYAANMPSRISRL